MDGSDYVWLAPLIAFLVPAIGWGFREYWQRRKAKRQAAGDASKILSDKKKLLEEMISGTEDESNKEELRLQLDEVNTALLGLHSERLRRTLKAAGLPPEEALIADGLSQLQPQQVDQLKGEIAEVENLPPSDSMQELLTLANAYYYAGQYQDAKDIYDRILGLRPDDTDTLNNRGVTYAKLERYPKALADYNRTLELQPDDPTVLSNRGNTYGKLGRYDKALADFNRSLELRPNDPVTLNNRGIAYSKLERYDEALADYNRSLELRPDHEDTLYNLACLFSLWKKTDDALTYLKKAIEIDKKNQKDAKTDEDFNNIREDPRFKKLVESD